MTDVTSESLYNKLNRVNSIKRNLKEVIYNIGGYEYIEDDPLFEKYPEIFSQIHSRIGDLCNYLDMSIYGKSVENVLSRVDTTYKTIIPYLDELQICRANLIANLNTKGVTADTNETLRSLVNKVLDIEGGGGGGSETYEPFSRVIYTQWLNEQIRMDVVYKGELNNNYYNESIYIYFVNVSDNIYQSEDVILITLVGGDNGLDCYFDYRNYITPHDFQYGYVYGIGSSIDTITEDTFKFIRQFVDNIETYAYINVEHYDTNLLVDRSIDFFDKGTLNLHILKRDSNRYVFYMDVELDNTYGPGGVGPLNRYGDVVMYSPDESRHYYIEYINGDPSAYWYSGNIGYQNIYCYNSQMVEDFSTYETNKIDIINK